MLPDCLGQMFRFRIKGEAISQATWTTSMMLVWCLLLPWDVYKILFCGGRGKRGKLGKLPCCSCAQKPSTCFNRSRGLHVITTPILVHFTELSWLIATFFFFFFFNCHSTACSVVGRVSLTITSIWNRCAALLQYAKSSPPLCCGYFEIGGELGYKSHPIILSTLDSRSKEAEMRPGSVEKSLFNRFCFRFFARRGGDDRVQSCCSQSGTECALRQSSNC